jgi:hypothetical protein
VSPRLVAPLAALVALVALAVIGGVLVERSRSDDELDRPTARTTTTVPAPSPSPSVGSAPVRVPARIPVGDARLAVTDPVWAQGSTLVVGASSVDLSPRRVDSLVAVPGGVYFLDDDELWFTDLDVVRATGLTGATGLAAAADGHAVLVTTGSTRIGYDAVTGRRVLPRTVRPATAEQLLGEPSRLRLRPERSDVATGEEVPVRRGTGRFGLVDVEQGPLVAVDTTDDVRVPMDGVVGGEFELVRWTGDTTFYGLARDAGRPRAVLACDLRARGCRTVGTVDPDESLLFASGA